MFSDSEQKVVNCVMRGLSNDETAKALGVKVKTVKWHLTSVYRKAQVTSRAQFILKGIREGYVNLESEAVSEKVG